MDYLTFVESQPTQVMRVCGQCKQLAPIGTTADVSEGKSLCLDCYAERLEQIEHPDDEARLRAEAFGPDQPSQDELWQAARYAWEREHEGEWDNYVPDDCDESSDRWAEQPESL